ncbi:MAG: dTMP kinase, partial [gamma proteobacterium symbiont of Stewartia floridana]
FEKQEMSFFEKVRAGYLEIAAREPHRVKIVDASKPLETVQQQIHSVVSTFLEQSGG